MTTSAELRQIAVNALKGNTTAGQSVFSPRDLASWEGEYPMLVVTAPEEEGESTGPHGAPTFKVTTTLHVHARVERAAGDNDIGAIQAQADLEVMREQIKAALINYTPLMRNLQQYPFFRSQMQVGVSDTDTAMHQGSLQLQLGMEFIQGPQDFYQPPATPLEGVDARLPAEQGAPQLGADINLPQ
ncbi:MAG: hypothetical protein GAK35_03393 [Herbaspirillum frisingense]|uniref:Uncharacterized protein n=1 Tax=Herbaspirillum frisingense TaxID=92645 RepID=A0A7V8FUD5_9BURK|nr:MAG: hypothetical protein GAK35_03393 [Herbaspirillum frisingense]